MVIEFSRDVVQKFVLSRVCAKRGRCAQPVGSIPFERAGCRKDGQLRTVMSLHAYSGEPETWWQALEQPGTTPVGRFRRSEQRAGSCLYPLRRCAASAGDTGFAKALAPCR